MYLGHSKKKNGKIAENMHTCQHTEEETQLSQPFL